MSDSPVILASTRSIQVPEALRHWSPNLMRFGMQSSIAASNRRFFSFAGGFLVPKVNRFQRATAAASYEHHQREYCIVLHAPTINWKKLAAARIFYCAASGLFKGDLPMRVIAANKFELWVSIALVVVGVLLLRTHVPLGPVDTIGFAIVTIFSCELALNASLDIPSMSWPLKILALRWLILVSWVAIRTLSAEFTFDRRWSPR